MSLVVTHAQTANDIVLYATDFGTIQGNWALGSSGTAAGGQRLASVDYGRSPTSTALSNPADYVEATFTAPGATAYHVWLRLRASNDSKYNDSVSVQFSDAIDANGSRIHAIGSTAGLVVNLATEAGGGSLAGWGWQDGAYWLQQTNTVRFSGSGSHTIRIQTREDGVQFDQVVLSPATYFSSAPGQVTNDATIVSSSTTSPSTTVATSSAYSGVAATLPGQVNAETFDNGGEGVGYHDTSGGNNGGQVRGNDVDIEGSSEGGYDVGWTAAGEWLNYTVNPTAGAYTLQLRVASPNGGAMHVGFNGASNVWTAVTVPATGGWQSWTTVTVPVTLASGAQQMTIMFDTGGINFRYVKAVAASAITAPVTTVSSSGPYKSVSLPGKVEAEDFDNGGAGVGYRDTSSGNNGGAYRATDVDIEPASGGGYDVGWTAAGEWLNYTVNVTSAGAYTAQVRVASPNGGQLHIGFNGPSGVWTPVTVPSTGGWQSWATVNVPVTLGAGTQQMTVWFDTAGVNLDYVNVVSGSSTATPTAPPSSSGTELIVAEWNIQVDDSGAGHARAVMDVLTSLSPRPQVIVVTEAHGSQYNTYINQLNNNTGLNWQGVFQPHCPPGAWNGSWCTSSEDEGVAVFSSLPTQGSSAGLLPYADAWHSARAWVRLAVSVGGVTTQVFGTHLQVSNVTARNLSMSYLKDVTSYLSGPKIAGGDFNADPDQIDTTAGMRPNFVDSWGLLNSTRGFTCNTPYPTLKLDYWFMDQSGRITPNWSSVVTWPGTTSDHFPVHASFTIR